MSANQDQVPQKSYDLRLLKRLLRYVLPYRGYILKAFVCLIVFTFIDLFASVYLYKVVIDEFIVNKKAEGLTVLSIIYLILLVAGFFFQYIEFYLVNVMSQKAMFDLRLDLFRHLERMSLSFFNKRPVGSLLTRLSSDIEALDSMFSNCIVFTFNDILIILGLLGIMLWMSPFLTLIALVVLPVIGLTSFIFQRNVRASYRDVRKYISQMNSFLQENISGMETVQVFNREEQNYQQFTKLSKAHTQANLRSVINFAFFVPTVEFMGSLAAALLLWFGGLRILAAPEVGASAMTFGTLVAFIQATQKFFSPIRDLADKFNILQTAMAASERVFGVLDTDESIPEAETQPVQPLQGRIEFHNVWFAYKEEEWILRDVSFSIEPGQRIAFVGATGAGKSTIINLLFRFYDVQRGAIFIDGVNIKQYPLKELRSRMGLVLQDVYLFSGDIAGNIGLGRPDISETAIQQAAQAVQIDHFIESLPNGYHTEVKERGATFSVGQRQLLSFARALVIDPKILLLDEATSSVDTETEHLVQEAMDRLMVGRTCLIIAHRLSTIRKVDEILVLHKGCIAERGSHEELIKQRGLYHKLYQLQYKDQYVEEAVR
ncbi:MAG: ABC transporter ATP-binding protein [bacterium]|nr:ABC transporter ATP-binding protein [bacterium]